MAPEYDFAPPAAGDPTASALESTRASEQLVSVGMMHTHSHGTTQFYCGATAGFRLLATMNMANATCRTTMSPRDTSTVLLRSDSEFQAFGQNHEGLCDVLTLEAGYMKTVAKKQGRAAEVRGDVAQAEPRPSSGA